MTGLKLDSEFRDSCCHLNRLANVFHENATNKGFHGAGLSEARREERFPRWCMLIVSEVAEAMEAHRCNEGDDRIAEELADAVIRILDTAKAMNLNIGGAVFDKAVKNDARPKMHGGKLY